MIVKSVIAGTVLSLMAGGIVYFGTDIDAGELKDKVVTKTAEVKADISDKVLAGGHDHPHGQTDKDIKESTDMPSVKTPAGEMIEAKKPTVSYSNKDKEIKTVEVASPERPQKKWLSQYLKSEKSSNAEEEPAETKEDTGVAKDLMDSMGLIKNDGSDSDTGTFVIEGKSELTEAEIKTAEAEGFEDRAMETENIWVEDKTSDGKTSTRKMLRDLLKKNEAVSSEEDGQKKVVVKVVNDSDTTTTETIEMGDGKTLKIIKQTVTSDIKGSDNKDMQIRVFTHKDGTDGISAEDIKALKTNKDISGTVKVVMEQAKKIEMPELRDRAYLDLVSYALDHGDYDVAAKALTKIDQVELRDTARNRIAIAHAKSGNAADAFGILADLEVDALRDVMRLQVIEAMIAPDALPKDMQ